MDFHEFKVWLAYIVNSRPVMENKEIRVNERGRKHGVEKDDGQRDMG